MGERMTVGQEQHARMLAERWAAVPWDVTAANEWLRAANDAHEWPEDPREDESRAMVAEYIEEFIDVDCDELTGMLMDALRLATRDRARLLAELDAVREDRDTLASALAEHRRTVAEVLAEPHAYIGARERAVLDALAASPVDLAAQRDARMQERGAWWALARHCHEASIAWTEQQAKAVCAEGRKRDALDDEAEKGGA